MKKQQTKKGGVFKIRGKSKPYSVLGVIEHKQSSNPNKYLILQRLQFNKDGHEELRFTYSVKGRKPPRTSPIMPVRDFMAIVRKAAKKWGI